MRNAAGLTNLTARPVSSDQLTAMLRGSPVASLIPEDDSTTPPLDLLVTPNGRLYGFASNALFAVEADGSAESLVPVKELQDLKAALDAHSIVAITDADGAIARILNQLEHLCAKDDADKLMSKLLRKFDVVTGLSAWSDPKNYH